MGITMTKSVVTKKIGRPRVVIDFETVERLALIQCTESEIAHVLNISSATLRKNKQFLALHKKGIENGKKSLRRLQWSSAEGKQPELVLDKFGLPQTDLKGKPIFTSGQAPNVTMQIWLGKQYLGQSDKSEMTGAGGGAIQVNVDVEAKILSLLAHGAARIQEGEDSQKSITIGETRPLLELEPLGKTEPTSTSR